MEPLLFTIKDVYGKTLYYPANETAETACKLIGAKTMTLCQMDSFRKIGVSIQIQARTA